MTKIPVSDKHPDHYLRLEACDGATVVWWDGFTGLQLVVTNLDLNTAGALGAGLLVSVIDRHGAQTFAWAFHANSAPAYIRGKSPPQPSRPRSGGSGWERASPWPCN